MAVLITLNYNENPLKISPSYKTSAMQDVHMVNKEGNVLKWELSAERAVFPKGNREILLESLGLKIKLDPEIHLTSKSGTYTIENGDMTLNNPVELRVKDAKFKTAGMYWDNRKEILRADSNVEFSGANFRITGKGLTAKTKEQKVRILKDVKAIFYL